MAINALWLAPLLAQASPASVQAAPPAVPVEPATVCQIIQEGADGRTGSRTVAITGYARFDFEYGFFLQADAGCVDPIDNTGLIRIDLTSGTRDDPELAKLMSDDWLGSNIGKAVRCTCVGIVTYRYRMAFFTLTKAERVWAE